jgi:hypothetical protein
MDYTFALRGDGETPTQIVAPADQRRALAAVLATLKPEALALPESLLRMIPPRPPEYERGREHFKIRTSPAFDALAPAEAAAQHTLQFLFNPERAARLVEFHARNAENPGIEEVLDDILNATWKSPREGALASEVARVVDDVTLRDLISLAADESASEPVRAMVTRKLAELALWISHESKATRDSDQIAHQAFAARQIQLFLQDPKRFVPPAPSAPPDGPPIGADDDWDWQP